MNRHNSRPKICATVFSNSIKTLSSHIKKAEDQGADLIELRIDCLDKIDVNKVGEIVESIKDTVVVTCRSSSEGGFFRGGEEERLRILLDLSLSEPSMMDIELRALRKHHEISDALGKCGVELIASLHDFSRTPVTKTLEKMSREALSLADYSKIVTKANSLSDNSRILRLYNTVTPNRLIAFCAGAKGVLSRILCAAKGAPFTYASLPNRQAAPGILSIEEMREFLDVLS